MHTLGIVLLAVGALGFFEDPNEFEELPQQKFPPHEEEQDINKELQKGQMEEDLEWLDQLVKQETENAQMFEVEVLPRSNIIEETDEEREEKEDDILDRLSDKELEAIKAKVLAEILKGLEGKRGEQSEEKEEKARDEEEASELARDEDKEEKEEEEVLQDLEKAQIGDSSNYEEMYTTEGDQQTVDEKSSKKVQETEAEKLEELSENTLGDILPPAIEQSNTQEINSTSSSSEDEEEEEEDFSPELSQSKVPYSLIDQDENFKFETSFVENQIESSPSYNRGSESEDALEEHELKTQIFTDSASSEDFADPFEEELETEPTYSSIEVSQAPFLAGPSKQTLNEMRLEASTEDLSVPSSITSSPEVATTNWGSIFVILTIFFAFLGLFTMYLLFIKRKKRVKKHGSEMRTFNPFTGQNEKYRLLKA